VKRRAAKCRFKFRLLKCRQFAQDSETAGLHKVIFNKKAVTVLSCDRFFEQTAIGAGLKDGGRQYATSNSAFGNDGNLFRSIDMTFYRNML